MATHLLCPSSMGAQDWPLSPFPHPWETQVQLLPLG